MVIFHQYPLDYLDISYQVVQGVRILEASTTKEQVQIVPNERTILNDSISPGVRFLSITNLPLDAKVLDMCSHSLREQRG